MQKIFYIISSIFVKYQCKIFNVFKIIQEMRMHKYWLFWGYLIYLNIRTLHKAKTYTKIFASFQIITTSRVINLITRFTVQKDVCNGVSKNDLRAKHLFWYHSTKCLSMLKSKNTTLLWFKYKLHQNIVK